YCVMVERQHYSKSRADRGFTLDCDSPPMRFDNHLGLKHTDAESLLLCALKRTKETRLHECLAHSAPIIADRYDYPLVVLRRFNSYLPFWPDSVASIQKQIGDYTAELIAIEPKLWLQSEPFRHVNVCSAV